LFVRISILILGLATNRASIGLRKIAPKIAEIRRCEFAGHSLRLLGLSWGGRELAGKRLVVDMGELPARVFQEELALDGIHTCKDIHK
jgi:hypothetical protein